MGKELLGVLETLNPKQRKFFLLEFTKELVKNYKKEIFELEILRERPSRVESKVWIKPSASFGLKPIIRERKPLVQRRVREIHEQIPRRIVKPPRSYVLRVPEPELPAGFQYLKPVPGERQVDLGKLNLLVKDPAVKSIECNGPGKRIVVVGGMGMKPTNIILTKGEIDEVIEKFSETAKIPIHSGVFKVVVGRLILTAIVSDVVGTKFVIKKMTYGPIGPKIIR